MQPRYIIVKLLIAIVLTVPFSLQSQDFKTIGYLPYYRFSLIDQINLEKITHLNIAFAAPDNMGQVSVMGIDIAPIVEKGHAAGNEVFIALAGGSTSSANWLEWLAPTKRSELVHNIIQYTLLHNLDGIDVDLEWGDVTDDYSGFVLELRDSVDVYGLQLSVALPGTFRYPEVSQEALDAFDWVNMMVYDLTGPWAPNDPGPHSPYYFAENAIAYWLNEGVERERLTLGVPFYGYDFTDQSNVVSRTFAAIVAMDADNAFLDQAGEIYYNGLLTIENKTRLAMSELSGIMIWELGQDSFDEFSLLGKIRATIDNTVSAKDELQHSQALVFPNPFTNQLNIHFDKVVTASVFLQDMNGRIIQASNIDHQQQFSLYTIDLADGMYVLKIVSDAFSKSYKIIHR